MKERRVEPALNVLGETLAPCSLDPITGFYRDGCCNTGYEDVGIHVVCAKMTREFLAFSKKRGNDLSTPVPEAGFPGLKPGDRWCLCAGRWSTLTASGDRNQLSNMSTSACGSNAIASPSLNELKKYLAKAPLPASGPF